jgi:hypothetical protein
VAVIAVGVSLGKTRWAYLHYNFKHHIAKRVISGMQSNVQNRTGGVALYTIEICGSELPLARHEPIVSSKCTVIDLKTVYSRI